METRQTYLATQSDYHTHAHDLPPQMGGCYSNNTDVAAEAATAYFDILRAQTRERIERDNLRRVQANLDLARNRVKIGYANAAEV